MPLNLLLRWFNFEKITQALVAQQIYWYDLKELKNIIQTVCFVDSDEEVSDMLDFYHGLGIIVKHGSTVVFRATWLADVFKRLITICPQQDMVRRRNILTPVLPLQISKCYLFFIGFR